MTRVDAKKVITQLNHHFGIKLSPTVELNQDEMKLTRQVISTINNRKARASAQAKPLVVVSLIESDEDDDVNIVEIKPSVNSTSSTSRKIMTGRRSSAKRSSLANSTVMFNQSSSSSKNVPIEISIDDEDDCIPVIKQAKTDGICSGSSKVNEKISSPKKTSTVTGSTDQLPSPSQSDEETKQLRRSTRTSMAITNEKQPVSFVEEPAEEEDDLQKLLDAIEHDEDFFLFTCPYCRGRTETGRLEEIEVHMRDCPKRKGREWDPTRIANPNKFLQMKVFNQQSETSHQKQVANTPSTATIKKKQPTSTSTSAKKKREVGRKEEETEEQGCYLCPYCQHRAVDGNLNKTKAHMAICELKMDRDLDPFMLLDRANLPIFPLFK